MFDRNQFQVVKCARQIEWGQHGAFPYGEDARKGRYEANAPYLEEVREWGTERPERC